MINVLYAIIAQRVSQCRN